MGTVVLNQKADCSKCVHFRLEGIEGVCYEFNQVIEDNEPLCSAFKELQEVKNE